jgi:hypothetical protein
MADGGAAKVARENTLIMAMALWGSASEASSKGAATGMGKAAPIKAEGQPVYAITMIEPPTLWQRVKGWFV